LRLSEKPAAKRLAGRDMLLRIPDIWADRQVSPTVFDLWQGGTAAPPVCFCGQRLTLPISNASGHCSKKWHKNGFFAPVDLVPKKNAVNNGGIAVWKTLVVELSQKWARRYSTGRILWVAGFVLAILSLVATVAVSCRSGQQLQEATRVVTHTREVLEKLGDIAARLSEVESAARSFAISGKQSHLSPFYTAAEAVPPQVDELKAPPPGRPRSASIRCQH